MGTACSAHSETLPELRQSALAATEMEETAMILGRWICKLLGRHRWSRAYKEPMIGDTGITHSVKRCCRCGLIRSVKRRAKKEGTT